MRAASIPRCSPASPDHGRRHRHLRLPPQRLRIRGDPARGASAPGSPTPSSSTAARSPTRPSRQARQSIRRLKRERPQARIVVTGCAAQTQAAMFADMAEVDRVVGNDDKMRGEAWRDTRAAFDAAGFGIDASEKIAVADIMAVQGDGAASAGRLSKRPAAGVRAGAERLRSPLHLLHHPLWPRQFALGADGRGGRPGPRAGRARPCRDRADRRRSHQLRRRSAGRAEARRTDKADPAACAGAEAAADFVDRFDRGRSRSARRASRTTSG